MFVSQRVSRLDYRTGKIYTFHPLNPHSPPATCLFVFSFICPNIYVSIFVSQYLCPLLRLTEYQDNRTEKVFATIAIQKFIRRFLARKVYHGLLRLRGLSELTPLVADQ